MPPIISLGDQNELVPAAKFPYAKFPFEYFNPVQSRVFDYYDKDMNGVIASATSSGKTASCEMILSHEIRTRGGKGMYIAPLRALAQEKVDEWTDKNHHFSDLKISILTGDYRLTDKRQEELEKANLILMTSEMLNARTRNFNHEKSNWIKAIKVLVIDEAHLLNDPGRGDHLESGLMKFTALNPDCKVVLLSATMPNVEEIAEWLSYILNKKETFLIKSKYRPCPLNLHYEKYFDGEKGYEDNQENIIQMGLDIVKYYPEDKFLLFAHTKRTGEKMKLALQQAKIDCEFHNADLEKSKRVALEKKFKEDPNFRAVVATSTLASGLNLPARRVVVLGVHRGMSEVGSHDIIQMCVASDNRIMMASGEKPYVLAFDIKPGDQVVGIKNDILVPSKVEKIIHSVGKAREISLHNGTTVVLSNHPVLTWEDGWKNSDNLSIGDKIRIVANHYFEGTCKSIKDILFDSISSTKGSLYVRLTDCDKSSLFSLNYKQLSEVTETRVKSLHSLRKRGVLPLEKAIKNNCEIKWLRSKNGAELDLDLIPYDDMPYFLGLLASDGNVKLNRSHSMIRLGTTSSMQAEVFANFLRNCGLYVSMKTSIRNRKSAWLEGSSKMLVSSKELIWREVECSSYALTHLLHVLGFTNRKSRTIDLAPLLQMKTKDMACFLLGVIDGDGSRSKNDAIRICTASLIFANQLKEMLLRCGVRSNVRQYAGQGHVFGYKCDTTHYIVSCGVLSGSKLSNICGYAGEKMANSRKDYVQNSRPQKGDTFYTKVESISELQEVKLINFQVAETSTFIVEDVITHNCGRAGRPAYDPVGDAYILLPERQYDLHKERLKKPQLIKSQLDGEDHKTLAFHLISEIHQENVTNKDDVANWYKRSLAFFQSKELEAVIVEKTIDSLKKCGAIWDNDGTYSITPVGKIASMFYFSPFDVSDLHRNFEALFDGNHQEDDCRLAMALGNTDTHRCGIVSKIEREEMGKFQTEVEKIFGKGRFMDTALKAGCAYYNLMNGINSQYMAGMSRGLQFDFERLSQVIQSLGSFTGKWNKSGWFEMLKMRIGYGVKGQMVYLCQLPNVGRARANKLWQADVKSLQDVVDNPAKVKAALGFKQEKIDEIISHAQGLLLVGDQSS